MPDKPTGPEQVPPTADAGQAASAPDDLKTMLERERQARLRSEQERDQIRTAFNRRDAEIRQLRELAEQRRQVLLTADDDPNGARRTSPEVETLRQRLDSIQQGFDYYRFRADHPDATDPNLWQDVQALVNDPNRVGEVAAFLPGVVGPDGQPVADVYKTLRNAMREVQYQRLQANRAQSDEQRRAAEAAATTNRGMGTISGSAASGAGETLNLSDLEGKSSEEILKMAAKAGILGDIIDPNDPPLAMRRK